MKVPILSRQGPFFTVKPEFIASKYLLEDEVEPTNKVKYIT